VNPIAVFIAWYNLDLGIQTCSCDGMDSCDGMNSYEKAWLKFIFTIYV